MINLYKNTCRTSKEYADDRQIHEVGFKTVYMTLQGLDRTT